MKKILVLLALLSTPTWAQYAHRSNPGDPTKAGQAITSAGASNCPGTGCVVINAQSVESVQIAISGTWTATLAFLGSNDGWVTTIQLLAYPLTSGALGSPVNTTTANGVWLVPCLAMREVGVFANAFTSNTSMAIRMDGDPVTNFTNIRDVKDGLSRSSIVIGADGVTPAVAETVITFQTSVNGTVTTGPTSYTITANKILRIQSINCAFTAGATANTVRPHLRFNTGGACVAGSNLLLPICELSPGYGTVTAAEGESSCSVTVPDGLEIAGDGTKALCLTENAVAASGTLTCNLVAYEY